MSLMVREAHKRVKSVEAGKANADQTAESNEAGENEEEATDDAPQKSEAERTKEENVSLESKVFEASLRRLKELAVSLRYGTNKCD